jgi:hypothetical protein
VSRIVGKAMALALPNLDVFDFKSAASYHEVVVRSVVVMAMLSALAYVALFLWVAGTVFSRSDIK